MTAQPNDVSYTEFVAWEELAEAKHEFAEGTISAFAGGTLRHASIAAYMRYAIVQHVRGGRYRVLGSDALIATRRSYPVAQGRAELTSVGLTLDLDDIYQGSGV